MTQRGTNFAPTNLADILERVLDKGIVIAGDISVAVGGVDLLTIRIRLVIASYQVKVITLLITCPTKTTTTPNHIRITHQKNTPIIQNTFNLIKTLKTLVRHSFMQQRHCPLSR